MCLGICITIASLVENTNAKVGLNHNVSHCDFWGLCVSA